MGKYLVPARKYLKKIVANGMTVVAENEQQPAFQKTHINF